MSINHQNNFATNLTGNLIAGVTNTPLNSIPSIAAPFYLALDATNLNGKYEVVLVTSKDATSVNHAATSYAHTTSEEVRCVCPAIEMDSWSLAVDNNVWNDWTPTITYAGGTTNPTSNTVNYARYKQMGKLVLFYLKSTLVKGTGDRTYTVYTLPVAKVSVNWIQFSSMTTFNSTTSYGTAYSDSTTGIVLPVTMNQDGVAVISGFYETA
jgi:hypothetical protein